MNAILSRVGRALSRTIIAGFILFAASEKSFAINTGLEWIDANTNLTFYGDLRLRYEVDWDSQTAGGAMRDDRHRGRIRARGGFNYKFADDWTVGARIRTGSSRSQQSPHLTWWADDGPRDSADFVADRYFIEYKHDALTAWGGRNISPFWQQNELFWDEDVTPTGVAAAYDLAAGSGKLSLIGGAFILPDGGYDPNGQLFAAQAKYVLPVKPSQFTFAAGIHFMNGEEGANNLLNRNGERDYLIGVFNAQWSMPIEQIKGMPITVGADLFNNFLDYDAVDVAPLSLANQDETLGYVLSVQLGQLKQKHDWLVGYYWAHIETFSVNASYAQDDWIRFGTGPQTHSSDFEGHEFRLAYAISSKINVVGRLYLVDAITTRQDGKRFRLDLNWRF